MPLPPLADPKDPATRVMSLLKVLPTVAGLSTSLLALNAAQTASLALKPLSRHAFRRFNRWAANTWWGWTVAAAERMHGTRVEISGDDLPPRESAIVVANHQQMADITYLMFLARGKGRLGDMKWFVKDPLKYVPGVGWGMVFLDCLFVKRNWNQDQASIERTFGKILRDRVPLWLISFVEGTRVTPQKVEQSREYAAQKGLKPTAHVLLPRTKGFVASVQGLRHHVDAVYDVTIGYEEGVPSLWQYAKGYSRVAHLHVRRHPIELLPAGEADLSAWLIDRFWEKDARLARFYERGTFSDADADAGGPVWYNDEVGIADPQDPDAPLH